MPRGSGGVCPAPHTGRRDRFWGRSRTSVTRCGAGAPSKRVVARSLAAATVVGLVLAPLTALPATRAAGADVPVIVVDGKGWGHGVGMAQDGAYEMGRRGFNVSQILGQFYPGTSFVTVRGDVRVPVLGAGAAPTSATVRFPNGGEVRDALSGTQSPGFPVKIPAGGEAVIGWNGGRYTVSTGGVSTAAIAHQQLAPPPILGTTTTTRPAPAPTLPAVPHPAATTTTTRPPSGGAGGGSGGSGGGGSGGGGGGAPPPAPPPGGGGSGASSARPLWAVPSGSGMIDVPGRARSYRGVVEAEGSTGALRLVNQVNVETYLVGMGEVPGSWPLAAVEAQEVAARTYAMRAMAAGGEICDDTRCQVYLGVGGENPGAARATQATSGQALASGGSLADTVYSANAAGISADQEEGFGVADSGYPYLRAAPYPAGDLAPYSLHFSTADVAARLGIAGPIDGISVSRKGPSGRALEVTLTSGGNPTRVSGLAFAGALGLRSTMIDVRLGADAVAPAPPPPAAPLQVLPDQVAEVARVAPAATADTTPPAPAAVAGVLGHHKRGAGGLPVIPVGFSVLLLAGVGGTVAYQTGLLDRLRRLVHRP